MILLSAEALPPEHSAQLEQLQAEIDDQPDYPSQVARAKARWASKPARVFQPIKQQLARLCSGNTRCVYCEDSMADEIEHMRPKDLYPEQCFQWANYVLACGPCNGPKNNRFAILDARNQLVDVSRRRAAPPAPPPSGRHALIDPRLENPIDFLYLDWQTFRYTPNTQDQTSELWLRARYTLDVLRLNERDALVRGRHAAFRTYLAWVKDWHLHHHGWAGEEQQRFIESFKALSYRGVWERMKRYPSHTPQAAGLALLFSEAPEVLGW
ncbi:hypothetical protein [Pseudomonas sp. NPDC007930]|uniref:hypothetical protein n=1 Tax=Pseudomonas sp. NPDC007930 TaxID=3364417 RepID=UPI0036EC65E8